MEKELTLNEIVERMKKAYDKGYTTYFKGRGNGIVIPIIEVWYIVNK